MTCGHGLPVLGAGDPEHEGDQGQEDQPGQERSGTFFQSKF